MQPNLTSARTEAEQVTPEPLSPYFLLAQFKKAIALADVLSALGISSTLAGMMTEPDRRLIAKLAGEMPAQTSWPVALELLRDRESVMEKFAEEREMLQCA